MGKHRRSRVWQGVKDVCHILVVLAALFGAYTGYHFYFSPTGLMDATHRRLHRAELIDLLIGDAVAREKDAGTGPTVK